MRDARTRLAQSLVVLGIVVVATLEAVLATPVRGSTVSMSTTTPGAATVPPPTARLSCRARTPVTSVVLGEATTPPVPATATQAVAEVAASPVTIRDARPFRCVLRWSAEWTDREWWVLGEFVSPWGAHFVVSESLVRGVVMDFSKSGPTPAWIEAQAHNWHMESLYTRFTPASAIRFIERDSCLVRPICTSSASPARSRALPAGTVVRGAAARLDSDSPALVLWSFVFYVQDPHGIHRVVAVTGGGGGADGTIETDDGFGGEVNIWSKIPPNLRSWVRSVVTAKGWKPSNL
jgi:hypothetical protein